MPDGHRHARLQERNLKKQLVDSSSSDKDEETGIACQTEVTETTSTSSQTDKELTLLERKELMELRNTNARLSKELEELKWSKEANFTEEYLKKDENQSILKFYTGMYC